jgi:hypothetical protein
VEGDASSASYFLAGAAITGGTVTVEGCGTSSLQVKPLNCFDCNSLKSGGMNLMHGNSICGTFNSLKETVLFLGYPLSHLWKRQLTLASGCVNCKPFLSFICPALVRKKVFAIDYLH